jgi:hypothetical protein
MAYNNWQLTYSNLLCEAVLILNTTIANGFNNCILFLESPEKVDCWQNNVKPILNILYFNFLQYNEDFRHVRIVIKPANSNFTNFQFNPSCRELSPKQVLMTFIVASIIKRVELLVTKAVLDDLNSVKITRTTTTILRSSMYWNKRIRHIIQERSKRNNKPLYIKENSRFVEFSACYSLPFTFMTSTSKMTTRERINLSKNVQNKNCVDFIEILINA